MPVASHEPVPADGVRDLRDALCEATWLRERDRDCTVTWPDLVAMGIAYPACVGAIRARSIRAHVDRLLAGPVGQIIAERDVARAANVDLHRRAQKAESYRQRHGRGINYVLNRRLEDRHARRAAEARAATLAEENERLKAAPIIEFHQQDWIPGFAAFLPGSTTPPPNSRAFCVLNLGSLLATVAGGDVSPSDLPGFVVESLIHEVGHVVEQWAGVEFSEERVEALTEKYCTALSPHRPETGDRTTEARDGE